MLAGWGPRVCRTGLGARRFWAWQRVLPAEGQGGRPRRCQIASVLRSLLLRSVCRRDGPPERPPCPLAASLLPGHCPEPSGKAARCRPRSDTPLVPGVNLGSSATAPKPHSCCGYFVLLGFEASLPPALRGCAQALPAPRGREGDAAVPRCPRMLGGCSGPRAAGSRRACGAMLPWSRGKGSVGSTPCVWGELRVTGVGSVPPHSPNPFLH